MATIKAFRALRPAPEAAAEVSAVPYDVVNTDEARQMAAGNALSFLHVSRPEIDLPDGTDPYSDAVYDKAEANFKQLRAQAPMLVEGSPSLYIYKLKMGDHQQTGLAATCSVAEYDGDIIRKHERTRKDKEDDRTRHILSLRAQTGPVFLTYKAAVGIDKIVNAAQAATALYDFESPDGIRHTVWKLSDESAEQLATAFAQVPLLYIADGHHRAASASRAAAKLKSEQRSNLEGEYNYFLAVLFPSDQVQILPYNRTVKDLNGLSEERFLQAVAERLTVTPGSSPSPSAKGEISLFIGGRWYGLSHKSVAPNHPEGDDLISSLDVQVLQDLVLEPILGIKDIRTDKRIDFVGGIRGTRELESVVNAGKAAAAFSMFPVTVDDLMAVADAGLIMPPKSTWFEPKLRDGLLTHLI